MDDLPTALPCPFCGSASVEMEAPLGPHDPVWIRCNFCGACGPQDLRWTDCVRHWNTAARIVAAVNHADALEAALRELYGVVANPAPEDDIATALEVARAVLASFAAAKDA